MVLLSHSNSLCDTRVVHIKEMKLVICTSYCPPYASTLGDSFKENLQEMKEVLRNLDDCLYVLMLGDFIVPYIIWPKACRIPNMLFMEQTVPHPTKEEGKCPGLLVHKQHGIYL